ncbi:hypothetical protein R6Q57_001806 [Mikania cordata]
MKQAYKTTTTTIKHPNRPHLKVAMDGRRKNIATASHGGSGGSNFQMPLHYPRYTKEEYKELPEGMIDRLLAEYGLSSSGHHDLGSKREFAMGAFLWPPQHVPAHHAGDLDHRYRLNMNVWSLLRKKKV